MIEYSHRLSATVLGVLVLIVAAMAWRLYRSDTRVMVSSTLALVLVIVAALVGGATVRMELAWWAVLLHLGVAQALVGCLVVVLVVGWKAGDRPVSGSVGVGAPEWFDLLVICTLVGAFALILSGSYMVGLGYGSACVTWPLCGGSVMSQEEAYAIHMAHRMAAVLVGALIVWTAATAWVRRALRPGLQWASLTAAGLFAAQTLVGAATVWTGFSVALKSVHLSMATLLWVSLTLLAALNFVPRWFEFQRVGGAAEPVSGAEGAAS